jgi:hypothetical protein
MKKRLLLRLGLLAAAGFTGLWLLLWWTAPAITRENFAKIEDGMTKAEVISILNGGPDYAPGELKDHGPFIGYRPDLTGHVWQAAEFRIHVFFDGDDKVIAKAIMERNSNRTFLQRVRRWLRAG